MSAFDGSKARSEGAKAAFFFGTRPHALSGPVIDENTRYDAARGYGWLERRRLQSRIRTGVDERHAGFVLGFEPAVYRIDVEPDTYRVTLLAGDTDFGNHALSATINDTHHLVAKRTKAGEYALLQAYVAASSIVIRLHSEIDNWVLNWLEFERVPTIRPSAISYHFAVISKWDASPDEPFRLAHELDRAKRTAQLVRADANEDPNTSYLELISGVVNAASSWQAPSGAIVDPHRGEEFQYSTPYFSWCAAFVAQVAGRQELRDRAIRALDWSIDCLVHRRAATEHEDFYPFAIAQTLNLLRDNVEEELLRKWTDALAEMDPFATYRAKIGGVSGEGSNWNIKALSGEYLLHTLGIRTDLDFVERSLGLQGRKFEVAYGMYNETSSTYDVFPRVYLSEIVDRGYSGAFLAPLRKNLDRGAITSLFLQSPAGELMCCGRSSHHQWNEALLCALFEINAAWNVTDEILAGFFKRGARLARRSLARWRRPSGEFQIVKNYIDPSLRHGYEVYSSHSQYNLLAAAMLCLAARHATRTSNLTEYRTPAELGGFVVNLQEGFGKVVANGGGTHVVVDTRFNPARHAAGLIRIHSPEFPTLLGPSDGLQAAPAYADAFPPGIRRNASIGVTWKSDSGPWRSVSDLPKQKVEVACTERAAEHDEASFVVVWTLTSDLPEDFVRSIRELYTITSRHVRIDYEVTTAPATRGTLGISVPLMLTNGRDTCAVLTHDDSVMVVQEPFVSVFRVPGATAITFDGEAYAHRNGFADVATFHLDGARASFVISQQRVEQVSNSIAQARLVRGSLPASHGRAMPHT